MLRCQFLCHVLKALFFIKIPLKLSYFCKKIAKFSSARGLRPQTPELPALGASPPYPHWPPAAGGSAPRFPKQPAHCKFLATRLDWGLRFQTPMHNIGYLNCINLLNMPPNCNIFCTGSINFWFKPLSKILVAAIKFYSIQ